MPKSLANRLGFIKIVELDDGADKIIRWTGTWGDISTQSFYPPHHLTMGEGGSVNIVNNESSVIARGLEIGGDCWCPSGIDNTCKKDLIGN